MMKSISVTEYLNYEDGALPCSCRRGFCSVSQPLLLLCGSGSRCSCCVVVAAKLVVLHSAQTVCCSKPVAVCGFILRRQVLQEPWRGRVWKRCQGHWHPC